MLLISRIHAFKSYEPDVSRSTADPVSISYTNRIVGETERHYLRTLPTHSRIEFEPANSPDQFGQPPTPFVLLLVHGSSSCFMIIRTVQPADWPAMAAIYQQGIDTGQATLETSAPPPDRMAAKYLPAPQLVADFDGRVAGYALLSAVSGRCVYGGVAEVSVYVDASFRGRGVGQRLLTELVEQSEGQGFWTMQAGIFPENTASVAIHERAGFRVIGYHEKLGQHHGIWRDVLLLERRSQIVGV